MMPAPRENKLTVMFIAMFVLCIVTFIIATQLSNQSHQIDQLAGALESVHAEQTATAQAPTQTPALTREHTRVPTAPPIAQPSNVSVANGADVLVMMFGVGLFVLSVICIALFLASRQKQFTQANAQVSELPEPVTRVAPAMQNGAAASVASSVPLHQHVQHMRAQKYREWAVAAELRRAHEAAAQASQNQIRLAEMELELAKMRNQAAHSVYPPSTPNPNGGGSSAGKVGGVNGNKPSGNDDQPVSQLFGN
jgi:hypothetical protein